MNVTVSNDAINATMGLTSCGTEQNDGSYLYLNGGTFVVSCTNLQWRTQQRIVFRRNIFGWYLKKELHTFYIKYYHLSILMTHKKKLFNFQQFFSYFMKPIYNLITLLLTRIPNPLCVMP